MRPSRQHNGPKPTSDLIGKGADIRGIMLIQVLTNDTEVPSWVIVELQGEVQPRQVGADLPREIGLLSRNSNVRARHALAYSNVLYNVLRCFCVRGLVWQGYLYFPAADACLVTLAWPCRKC